MQFLAKSQLSCTCRVNGNMSGASRSARSTAGSILRSAHSATALSMTAESAVSPWRNNGAEAWCMDRGMDGFPSGSWRAASLAAN